MGVGINQVAGYVLPHRQRTVAPQLPVGDVGAVAWCDVRDAHRAGIQAVPRQKALSGKHPIGVRVIHALGLVGAAAGFTFELLDQTLTAATQGLLIGIQRALCTRNLAQTLQLVQRPLQTLEQTIHHHLKFARQPVDDGLDAGLADHLGIRSRPPLLEGARGHHRRR